MIPNSFFLNMRDVLRDEFLTNLRDLDPSVKFATLEKDSTLGIKSFSFYSTFDNNERERERENTSNNNVVCRKIFYPIKLIISVIVTLLSLPCYSIS